MDRNVLCPTSRIRRFTVDPGGARAEPPAPQRADGPPGRARPVGEPRTRSSHGVSAAGARSPSGVIRTRTLRRSVASASLDTRPAATKTPTIRVIEGGCTSSSAASSPSVGCPSRRTVASADAWPGESPPRASWRRRRCRRFTATRRRLATSSCDWTVTPARASVGACIDIHSS